MTDYRLEIKRDACLIEAFDSYYIIGTRTHRRRASAIVEVNPLGREAWRLVGKGWSQNQILKELTEAYALDSEWLKGQLSELLHTLESCGYLTRIRV